MGYEFFQEVSNSLNENRREYKQLNNQMNI